MNEVIAPATETLSETSYPDNRSPKQRYMKRLRRMKQDVQQLIPVWQEAAQHFMPGSVRINSNDRLKAPVPNPDVVNGVGMMARRTMEAGIATSLTNPTRPWAALGTADLDLMKRQSVKMFYHQLAEWVFNVFARSNIYQVLPRIYGTVGTHGVACALLEEDPVDLIRIYPWTMGTFYLANGPRLEIDTAYRELQMPVINVVKTFGPERCSRKVRRMYENQQYDDWVNLVRVIEPNMDRRVGKLDYTGMPYRSYWMEQSGDPDIPFLRESGYQESPILAPRWETEGEDVYGRLNPGISALPDSRMLQQYGRREGQVVDYLTVPPVEGTSQMEGSYPLPGEVVPVPFGGSQNVVRQITETKPAVVEVLDTRQQRLENRVNEWWYVHLWMAILMDQRNQRATAREIAEQHEEKLIQLGPTLVRFFNELLDKMIFRTVMIGLRKSIPQWVRGLPGLFPPPPEELMAQPFSLKVEYISQLALAMKLVGISSIERLASFGGGIAAVYPEIIDKLNWDRMIEIYGDRLSTEPDLIIPQDVVDQRRQQRAQQKAQQAQLTEQLPAVAKSAEILSRTDVNSSSALNRLLAARGVTPNIP